MFSIIDNEIKVNFELLGGSAQGLVDGELAGSKDGAALYSAAKGAGNVAAVEAILANPGNTYGDPADKAAVGGMKAAFDAAKAADVRAPAVGAASAEDVKVLEGLVAAAVVKLGDVQVKAAATQVTGASDLETALKTALAAAKPLAGGAMDNALSKDIHYALIGGGMDELKTLLGRLLGNADPVIQHIANGLFQHITAGDDSGVWMPNTNGDAPCVTFEEATKRANGKLQIKDASGKWVNWTPDVSTLERQGTAVAFNAEQLNCFLHGNSAWNADGSESECVKWLNSGNRVAPSAIDKMEPQVVYNVLKSLGFKGVSTAGGVRCQSYSEWWGGLSKDQQALLRDGNGKVPSQEFLSNLVCYLNRNPAIINAGSSVRGDADKYNVQPARFSARVGYSLDDLRNVVDSGLNTYSARVLGLPFLRMGMRGGEIKLAGGAMAPAYLLPSTHQPVENMPSYSKQLRSIFSGYESRLRSYNKTLSAKTKEDVEKIFKSLEEHEGKARRLVLQIESYSKLVSASGNRTPGNVQQADIDKAVTDFEKSMGKIRKRSINIIDINQVVGQAVRDAELTSSGLPAFQA